MRILFVCERSGGHLFPAFSLAEQIRKEKEDKVYFFVTSYFLREFLKKSDFEVFGKSFPFRNIILEGIWRFFESIFLIFRLRPKKVIGFGGRDSFFLLFFARLLFIETAIYEPNASLGKANKVLSRIVNKVYYGFRPGIADSKKEKIVGIPLRSALKKIDKSEAKRNLGLDEDKLVITAIGGSQGSNFINSVFLKLIGDLKDNVGIIHLTGKKEYEEILRFYSKISIKAFVKDFFDEMNIVYCATDILISRAGALTLAEASCFGIPAVLFPHPQASSHQRLNASYAQERGAAIVFEQERFSFSSFEKAISKLISDKNLRQKMSDSNKNIKISISSHEFYKNIFS